MDGIEDWDDGCPLCGSSKYHMSMASWSEGGGGYIRLECPECGNWVEREPRVTPEAFETIDEMEFSESGIQFSGG